MRSLLTSGFGCEKDAVSISKLLVEVACGVSRSGNAGDLQHPTAAQLMQHQASIEGRGHLGRIRLHTPHKVQRSPAQQPTLTQAGAQTWRAEAMDMDCNGHRSFELCNSSQVDFASSTSRYRHSLLVQAGDEVLELVPKVWLLRLTWVAATAVASCCIKPWPLPFITSIRSANAEEGANC